MSVADLRRQAKVNQETESFRRSIVAMFVASLIGCAAPLMMIICCVMIFPRRKLLKKCGPLYSVMAYTALALSCVYSVLLVIFFLFDLM